ncbi:MAG: BolA/IbaG family iron-sulfur metabolism protein [Wenzhouxiangella sp.]
MNPSEIESLILQAMPGASVRVMSDDNVHYSARIVSADFAGLGRLDRHRRVHDAIGPSLGREIHALTLELKAPDEVDD